MGHAQEKTPFDHQAYLDWEATQAEKHEYIAGEVFAMVGARREHVLVSGAIFSRLRQHLRGSPCDTFASDMKLFVEAADAYFYPDLMVTCDERDRAPGLAALAHPVLIIEVLSDSTAAYDRGAKFSAYRKLPGLREYLLVDIDARRLELFRREGDHWLYFDAVEPDCLQLESVGLELWVAEAFEDLESPCTGT